MSPGNYYVKYLNKSMENLSQYLIEKSLKLSHQTITIKTIKLLLIIGTK